MRKRTVIFILCMLLICLAMAVGGTLGYFTTESASRGVITTGHVDISVLQQQEPIAAMPGTVVQRSASVACTPGSSPVWVRTKITVTVRDAGGSELPLSPEKVAAAIAIPCDLSTWTEQDGWWYCKEYLSGGESRQLFENVNFSATEMGNEFQNTTVEVLVTAQAVQRDNNGTTVFDAVGWPS